MAAKRKKSRRQSGRRNTPLSSHKRVGKQVLSPLGSLPNLRAVPWLRDLFPDYLWPCFHLSRDVDGGLALLAVTFDIVNDALDIGLDNSPAARPTLDSSLTSWEALDNEARALVLDALQQSGAYDDAFPEDFAHVLGMYPGAPGSWLIEPWRVRGLHIEPERAERALTKTILESAHGQDEVATRAKAIALRGLIVAQRIHVPRGSGFELLPQWPNQLGEEDRQLVESTIRASFGAFANAMGQKERIGWARVFWRANWHIFPCRIAATDQPAELPMGEIMGVVEQYSTEVDDLWTRFQDAAMTVDPDLYDPDRHEVLSGVVARTLRLLSSAISTPAAWTAEHSPPLMRAMVEGLIVLSWLLRRNERSLFTGFKDYGRGHLKLVKLHWEEFADSLQNVPDEVQSMIDDLDALVNQDIWEEFQNIDLSGSFAKIDTRKMAEEAGLLREYRLIFAPSSSDAHGEWGHLDRYALTRCMTAAHRFHRIPSDEIVPTIQPKIMRSMLDLGERLVDEYYAAIGSPPPDDPIPEAPAPAPPEEDESSDGPVPERPL